MSEPAWKLGRLLGQGNFRNLWLAQAISDFGDGLTNLTLLIMVNQLTGSTAALATMAIVLAIPQVTLGLVAGVYADRFDRKRIMLASDALRALLVLGFVLVDASHLWILYLLGFLQATVGTFFTPARGALLAQLLPLEALLAANSLTQTSRILAGLLGAGAAGVLVGVLGVYWPAFVTNAATFLLSFLLVSLVRVPRGLARAARTEASSVLEALLEGLRLIGRSRILLGTLTGAAVMMLGLGAVNVLFIPLLTKDLRVPPTLFGLVQLAETGGMILAGSLVVALAARLKPTQMVSLGMVVLGLGVGLIALVGTLWQVLALLFLIGLMVAPVQAGVSTLVQTTVDDQARGRVGAALSAVIGSANLVSMAFAGVLAAAIGVREVFVVSGLIGVMAGLIAFWVFGAKATPVTGGNL